MNLTELMTLLEGLAPLRYAEPWDNVGLLVGDPSAEIERVLVTVDYTSAVAEEAAACAATLVVAYHPPLFAAVKRVPHDALWAEAIRRGIALYSPHTALDVAAGGTNDFLADACGVSAVSRRALRPWGGTPGTPEPEGIGLGRVGAVADTSRTELLARIKSALGLTYLLVAGPSEGAARRVAVAAGAGGELLQAATLAGADVFVTGEVRHHDALAAAKHGMTVVATLHSNSERAAVRAYAARIARAAPGIHVATSAKDADPFHVV